MSGIPSSVQYTQLIKTYDQKQKDFNDSKGVKAEVDYFKKAIEKLEKPDDLFKDPRLLKFVTSALNLAGEEQYPGKLRRILTEKADDENAVLNRLSDKRFKQAAEKLRFGEDGLKNINLGVTQDELIASYKSQEFDKSIGKQNPALREAVYFNKFAANVSDEYGILADPIIRRVVTRTLGIPERIAFQPIETQSSVILSRIDPEKLKDPEFRDKFIKRYLSQQDLANSSTSSGASGYLTGLFSGSRGRSLNLFG